MGETPPCVCTMAVAPRKPLAGPIPPVFHLQETPAEFVAPVFLILQPDTSVTALRTPPRFHSGDKKTS